MRIAVLAGRRGEQLFNGRFTAQQLEFFPQRLVNQLAAFSGRDETFKFSANVFLYEKIQFTGSVWHIIPLHNKDKTYLLSLHHHDGMSRKINRAANQVKQSAPDGAKC